MSIRTNSRRKHCKEVGGQSECNYCSKVIRGCKNHTKYHLAHISGTDVETCHNMQPEIVREMNAYLESFLKQKVALLSAHLLYLVPLIVTVVLGPIIDLELNLVHTHNLLLVQFLFLIAIQMANNP